MNHKKNIIRSTPDFFSKRSSSQKALNENQQIYIKTVNLKSRLQIRNGQNLLVVSL